MIGKMDRRITLQAKTEAQNSYGEPVPSWSEFATVWAQKIEMGGREYLASQQVAPEVVRRYRIRYLSGLNESMRLVDENAEHWDIQRIAEGGRRQWLDITVKVPA